MKRFALPALCALIVVPFGGCRTMADKVAQVTIEKLRQSLPVPAPAAVDSSYVASLTPVKSGAGLVVCEPISDSALKNQGAWGAGVARWLQVQVAGQPQLGKTQSWGVIENARLQLKLANLQLDAATASQLARAAGVTHVAIGKLSGSPAVATLSYELRDVESAKVVGRAQLRGSLAQINAQLPTLAKTLALALNVKSGTAPKIALSVDELKFLGTPALKPAYGQILIAPQQARLKTLAAKDVLAGIMAQRWCDYTDDKSWQNVADTLTKMAPRNALVWEEVSYTGPIRVVPLQTRLANLQKSFPNSHLLAQAGTTFESGNRAWPLALQWAEQGVRTAPQSSYAWEVLANALSDSADAARKGRYSNQIGRNEWSTLGATYQKWHAVAQQATKVNAGHAYAWSTLAQAATFNGDDGAANAALEKAIALDATDSRAWIWGLEMTQSKWGGSNSKYINFSQRAASHANAFYFPAEDVSAVYSELNLRQDLKNLLETVVAKDPRNAEALSELGSVYHYKDRSYQKAEKLYRRALAINPEYARPLSMLGDLTYWVHNDAKGAEALYKRALASNPNDGYVHANLARMYALTGRKSQGVAEANAAKKLGFNDRSHPVWNATGVKAPRLF